ncbi:MAG: type IX secretion system membrane protein PorP/SprF, partial [Bacteroidota bacterium]
LALVLFLAALAPEVSAQQDPQFTQYFFNPLSVNSGYAGTREALNVTLLAREQWVGIDGRPRTQSVSVHTPLRNEAIALGLSFMRDEVGPVNTTAIYGDFAYRIKVNDKSRLAFGMKAGINLFTADLTSLRGTDAADLSFAQNLSNTPLPNFGFSLYWWADNFFVGASTPKLIENEIDQGSADMIQNQEKRHFFLMGGYVFDLRPGLKFKPTTQVKYVTGAPVIVDLTANFLIDEWLWVGGMYRLNDAVGLIASFQITDQLRAGYSYDYTLTELSGYNSGSHEIMLSYDFVFNKAKTLSPRYF